MDNQEQVVGQFWSEVKSQLGLPNSETEVVPEAWPFGSVDNPELADQLLALVLNGTKTGTASALWCYEVGEPTPYVGELSIILDGVGVPKAVIRTSKIDVVPFDEVTEEHAFSEGEGDRTLSTWRHDHEAFFKGELPKEKSFTPTMPVICERFELLWPRP